ncbi:MAG TPA: DegT/DnrJ/EryC1/StrS family aminotransferase [Flavobacteriales bacterium]|nr:DegT/DnrJ/EryC1/StrS family aminotransferase [Flavobacteriales bacterium]HMR28789.1 DegT/DnrJ/EryC1/StrS family aminotransferase [Flavobacteriales bacterium]
MSVLYLPHEAQQLLELSATAPDRSTAERLEARLAAHYGKRHALLVGDVQQAVLAVALAAGVRGYEVVVSPLEARGVAVLSLAGATLVPGILRSTDLTMDHHWLDDVCNARTRMLLASHTHGNATDHEALHDHCTRYGLLHVELGPLGAYDALGRAAGACAHVMVVDLSPRQGITAGQGAAIVTSDGRLHDRLVQLCGSEARQWQHLGDRSPANLHAAMHPMAIHLLDATWDMQWHRMAARQHHYARLVRSLDARFVTKPFRYARASTYDGVRLCARTGMAPELPTKSLRFIFRETGLGGLEVKWRIPRLVGTLLDALNQYRFAALTSFEKAWPQS